MNDAPLLVVDLDTTGPPRDPLRRTGAAPDVVSVGVSRAGGEDRALDGFDVALLEGPSSARDPWVHVPDLDVALDQLRAAVSRAPIAAVTLVHVLRAGERASFDDAMVVESLAYSTLQAGPEFGRWLGARPPPGTRPVETRVLAVERSDDQLDLVLDRPQVRNAVNAALRDALCEALDVARLDETVTRVCLSGRGPDFCSGGDLDEFGTAPDPASAHLIRTSRAPASLVAALANRAEVHLHGACVGAGIEIAAAAGRVVAAPDARLRLPELAMGLIPGAGGTASLPRRIGRHRTAWLALSGSWLDAGTAIDWGLVDEVAAG